ncbi:MAG: sugar kinase [Bacteroidia bacterium]|nr:sugar kinase [Bacteroidia bacterium]
MGKVLVWGEPMFGFYPIDNQRIEKCETIRIAWGGDASNFAIGVARLNVPVTFFTAVGTEPFGRGYIELWEDNNIDVSQVVEDPKRRTGFYFVSFIDGKHSLTYYRDNSAASGLTFDQLDKTVLKECDVFHFTGTGLGMGEAARSLCHEILKFKKGSGSIISFDVNYRRLQWNNLKLAKEEIIKAINLGVTHLEITDDEMRELGWQEDLDSLFKMFPSLEVIAYKQGSKGAIIKTKETELHSPAFPVEVVDTVGAGDSFDVGFIVSLMEGKSLEDAARIGNAMGGLTCTGVGPISSSPTREKVESFLANYDQTN